MVKGILLRIGIDMGVGGTLAPIFEDGSFEYIPFPERAAIEGEELIYSKINGRFGRTLADYLPDKYHDWVPHYDPEFKTPSYGDPTTKRRSLNKLETNDILVFQAGLRAFETNVFPRRANYIIGYFTVDRIVDFSELNDKKQFRKEWELLQENFHIGQRKEKDCLVVVGNPDKSFLFSKAIPFTELRPNKGGIDTVAITKDWEKVLGISGFVERSTPRWLDGEACNKIASIFKSYI